jgi:hypothetical protein
MTNTYMIQAWCVRPFIAYLDPIEAGTPEEAIAIARSQPANLLNTAEDCNDEYLWEEFAVFDEGGNELLRVLDEPALLRNATPDLFDALKYALEFLTANDDGEEDVTSRIAAAADVIRTVLAVKD